MGGFKSLCVHTSPRIFCQINKWAEEAAAQAYGGSSPPAATWTNHCGDHCTTAVPLKQQNAYRETLERCLLNDLGHCTCCEAFVGGSRTVLKSSAVECY